ncbi:unnamed protein product [Pylaiella littoralis]
MKAGVLKEGGLVLETFPTTSVFITKLAGRTAAKNKLHHSRQTSSILIAHKSPDSHLVLGEGRHLCALVADSASSDRLEKSLDVACTSGVKSGWFKEYTGADVIVGGNALPAVIPPHNMSQAAQNLVAETLEGYDDPDDEDQAEENLAEAALTAAENFAEEHGLEIREASAGGGLWATQDLRMDERVPFFAQGHFSVMTPSELIDGAQEDGVARHVVCDSAVLRTLLSDGEVIASQDRTLLVIALDPSCFLYYMNSCQDSPDDQNLSRNSIFQTKLPTKDTATGFLVDAEAGVAFTISREIKKGEQLMYVFPARKNATVTGVGSSGGGGEVALPARRNDRRTARVQAA